MALQWHPVLKVWHTGLDLEVLERVCLYAGEVESLARTVAIIVFTTIALGFFGAVVAVRPPKSRLGRIVVTVLSVPALVVGARFALLDIGMGARVIGGATFVAVAGGLVRTWRTS